MKKITMNNHGRWWPWYGQGFIALTVLIILRLPPDDQSHAHIAVRGWE